MPRFYEGPSGNYDNLETFKETAVKTLNHLFKRDNLVSFDFIEEQRDGLTYWKAIGYSEEEDAKVPAPEKIGQAVSEIVKQAASEAEAGGNAAAAINATPAAIDFATANGIDLATAQVKGSGKDGRIGKPDVEAFLKAATAPAKDKANEDGQQSAA